MNADGGRAIRCEIDSSAFIGAYLRSSAVPNEWRAAPAGGRDVTIGTVISEEQHQPPLPDPVVRFRIRTLLIATTCLAVLAAIAGPFYRSVNASGQRSLLLLWSLVAVCVAGSCWLRFRESFGAKGQQQVRHVVFAPGKLRSRWGAFGFIVGAAGTLAWLGALSYVVGKAPDSPTHILLYHGIFVGSTAASLVFVFVRRPIYLCEEGVPLAKNHVAPWKYIRHAEWVADRPGVMKLRRLDGDIYLDVPKDVRDAVESFVRGKIRFVDSAAGPRFEEPGAKGRDGEFCFD